MSVAVEIGLMRAVLNHVGVGFAWRYLCHSVMVGLSLLNEPRPGPKLHDRLLDAIPRISWVTDHNHHLWLVCYAPVALWFWRKDRRGFLHFLYLGGVVSLVRGICVNLTTFGPVYGDDPNRGVTDPVLLEAFWAILNPFRAVFDGAANLHLTKDFFFSGHTATTFLLWLYCRHHPWLGPVALFGHVAVVGVVLLAHIHYAVDIVGAWAITFSLYTLANQRWPHRLAELAGQNGRVATP